LPPLQRFKFSKQELLQQSLIQNIKKRNKNFTKSKQLLSKTNSQHSKERTLTNESFRPTMVHRTIKDAAASFARAKKVRSPISKNNEDYYKFA
jgi:hypothetical protein